MKETSVIAKRAPRDGREWDCQCARCGSSCDWYDCSECGGEGGFDGYEEDPNWYAPGETVPCHLCHGSGGGQWCISSEEWCNAHPMSGREQVKRGAIEWFTFDKKRKATK
jgi:hypothetical protein